MRRPGNLNGVGVYTSRKARQLGNFASLTRLSGFGKGAIAPPPAPPGSPSGARVNTDAWDASTKKFYVQDPQCPEPGTKMMGVPCAGNECCDAPGDCDPPGTVYQECDDDPSYRDIPEGTWSSCEAVRQSAAWNGVPPNLVQEYCNAEGLPEREPQAAPSAPQATASAEAAPAEPVSDAEKQKLEAELLDIELETQQDYVVPASISPASSTYTGGGGGSPGYIPLPRGTAKKPVTTQSKIRALVAQHQQKKSAQRAPVFIAPTAAPAAQMAPTSAAKPSGGGIISWLQRTLFGTPAAGSGLGSFGDEETMSPLVKIALLSGVAYIAYKHFNK